MSFWIGSGAGFSGDRVDAAGPVVAEIARGNPEGGAIIFETIGERTLALGQLARQQDPESGYEPLLPEIIRPILKDAVANDIAIIGNFGCANPPAAARVIRQIGHEQGLHDLRIAVIEGDDVRDSIDLERHALWDADRDQPPPQGEMVSANAYIGAAAIAKAITAGAQVIVTGRVADPALVLGPLVAHFGWSWQDNERLAAGTLAGHLLECGAQVTGGYFADPGWKDVPEPENIGFPIAQVEADGRFILTKPAGTGGLVDLRTVKEQILYEIHDPGCYLTPDVVLDITDVSLEQLGPDRVAVSEARGHARPDSLKTTVGFIGDWLGEAEISYAGPNAFARARLAAETIEKRLVLRNLELRHRLDVIGISSAFDSDGGELWRAAVEQAPELLPEDLRVRLAVSGMERDQVAAALQEVLALYCCGPAGGGGQRSRISPRIETRSYMVPRTEVKSSYSFL
ncbi:acyclic terpene utilization AtuA family protein [Fodinicurvata fenggangensis]|uniref:acyclic terpene utilization AtuA family protein n=1 Tax=Fodinicurvata fenggangensis TaxID=1121830 RepID=UPI00054E8E1F|nr:acyclic terpene utilization AtuA family protein [Fodinicurvata fenggangensis]